MPEIHCTLQTEGYRVLFRLHPDPARDQLPGTVEVNLSPDVGEQAFRSGPLLFQPTDLRRLVDYFEQHLTQLQQSPRTEAPVFTTWDLGFQFRAQSGDVESSTEGEFTLLTLVNVGQRKGCGRTYAGCEGVVGVDEMRAFLTSLESVLAGTVGA